MRTLFLDPNTYCYSEDEWLGGEALVRLDDLLTMMTDLDCSEDRLEVERRTSFLLPDEILWASYEMNPNINSPANGHYHRLFKSQIMPALERRKSQSLSGGKCDQLLEDFVELADCVAKDAAEQFLHRISRTEARSLVYAYHPQRISLALGSGCFSEEASITYAGGGYFVDYLDVFPLEKKKNVAIGLHESIEILRKRLGLYDAAWRDVNTSRLLIHSDFVASISGADFRNLESKYQERIIFTILQIATGRNLTTQEHSMTPQTISYGNARHGKWNAYVFQMGPDATDVRCSRLYFAKVRGGILLFRYEEDAHP